jgi:hypothetical protein
VLADTSNNASQETSPGLGLPVPPLNEGVDRAQEEDTISRLSKIALFMLVLLVGGCASSQPPRSTVNVPDKLRAGANQSLAMIVPARGVQIYECRANKNKSGFMNRRS